MTFKLNKLFFWIGCLCLILGTGRLFLTFWFPAFSVLELRENETFMGAVKGISFGISCLITAFALIRLAIFIIDDFCRQINVEWGHVAFFPLFLVLAIAAFITTGPVYLISPSFLEAYCLYGKIALWVTGIFMMPFILRNIYLSLD